MHLVNKIYRILLCAVPAAMLVAGCVPTYSVKQYDPESHDRISPPVGSAGLEASEVRRIIDIIETRNRTVEDEPRWIRRAYNGLMVRKLNNISEREYKDYRKYLDDGKVYIIVHPAFFPFFHFPGEVPDLDKDTFIPKHNVVERLLAEKPKDHRFALLQAQERRMRDFLEFMSTREKLVVVVVPRNYNRYKGYRYRDGYDEYTRYLNEVTNFSRSVIFAESRSPNRGYLTDEDGIRLMEFLLSIDAEKVYVGGGYIGRCLEDFYVLITEEFGSEGIYVIPELSDISPKELTVKMARNLLSVDGSINIPLATQYLLGDVYRIQEVRPRVENLPGSRPRDAGGG